MVKNYKLGLISVLVSCSLSNAMDSQESNDPNLSLHDVAVIFRDKNFLDDQSLLKSSKVDLKVSDEEARQAVCKKRECCDNDCGKFLGYYYEDFGSVAGKTPKKDINLLKDGYFMREGRCYKDFCSDSCDNRGFVCRNDDIDFIKKSVMEEKKKNLLEKIDEMKKKQKLIESKIVGVVGNKKYKKRLKDCELGFLMLKNISSEEMSKLSGIEGVVTAGNFDTLNYDILKTIRKEMDLAEQLSCKSKKIKILGGETEGTKLYDDCADNAILFAFSKDDRLQTLFQK